MIDLFKTLQSEGHITINSERKVQEPAQVGIEFRFGQSTYECFLVDEENEVPELRIYPLRGMVCIKRKKEENIETEEDLLNFIETADNYNVTI